MSDQLADTLAAFEVWRNSKPSKSNSTPITLRQQAVALFPHYSKSAIAKALRISGGQFKRWHLECQSMPEVPTFANILHLSQRWRTSAKMENIGKGGED
ncbi:MAG: hypothetical protein HRT35_24475 [Algicola sp.]|nr:hypothetical protein [Algicola sp.]